MKTNWKNITKIIIAFSLLLTITINGFSQVSSDYDHSVNFKQFKTYGFKPGVSIDKGITDKNNSLMDQKVNNAIATQLNAKGLRLDNNNPDLLVTYTFGVQEKTQIENLGPIYAGPGYYAPGGWWGNSWNNWWAYNYDEGTLLLDVLDAKTNKLVYRVYGTGEVKKPSKQQKEFNKIAEKGFKDYPM